MQESKERNADSKSSPKFIIPPGLILKRLEFESHYHISKGKPIIIVGPTGVGKTVFLHIFEKLYRKEHGNKVPVLRINCSHFDDQLVRSELFGHAKGAFTGAIEKKEGLIKKANGGVLFMEELGELPKDAQAKLLTVIEDGFFYRVGGTEPEKVSVQIVGTTNNTKNMREDFWQRFMPFYVPPLSERREDILYYLYDKFPELIKTLNPQEVLWLLTYNWPGNVRELERISRLLDRDKKMASMGNFRTKFLSKAVKHVFLLMKGKEGSKRVDPDLMSSQDLKIENFSKEMEESFEKGSSRFLLGEEHENFFSAVRSKKQLGEELKRNGVDIVLLDEILRRFRLSLGENSDPAFPELSKNEGEFFKKQFTHRYDPLFDVKQYIRIEILEEAKTGLDVFCSLFFQSAGVNKNLLDVRKGTTIEAGFESDRLPKSKRDGYLKLAGSIFEYLNGLQLPRGERIPEEPDQRRGFFADLADTFPSNKFLASILGREELPSEQQTGSDIWTMKHDELLRFYYKGMVERSGGVQEHAANRMGVNYRTFRSRCRSLGLRLSTK
jgi:energy-coupling factor transporter ATP-binding protein EcfA2